MPDFDDNFFRMLNTPRCKTAMLLITIAIFLTLSITESAGRPSQFIRELSAMAMTFWMGRISKVKENISKKY